MTDKLVFKVWNIHRTRKSAIILEKDDPNLYENLILKANEKLQVNGAQLVLEVDGTEVDDNETLLEFQKQILILLQTNEIWFKVIDLQSSPGCSNSTVTFIGTNELSSSNVEHLPSTITLINDTIVDNNDVSIISEAIPNLRSPPVGEACWRDFQIPWCKLPQLMLEQIELGNPKKDAVNEVVRLVIHEMRSLSKYISHKSLKIVAHKMIDKYPKSFMDKDEDGYILGDGSHSLCTKLQERNSYLNRIKRTSDNEPTVPQKKRRSLSSARAGCSDWEPEIDASPDISSKINLLNSKKNIDINNEEQSQLLEDTYPTQREYLNRIDPPPDISDIKNNWPILLDIHVIKWHYKKLTSQSINIIEDSLKTKYQRIISYAKKKKITVKEDDKYLECLHVIAKLLKEDISIFVNELDNKENLQPIKTPSPCIVRILGDNNKSDYFVSVENYIINPEGTQSFVETLKVCYACYYVFNMKYPSKISATLEFIQRYCMKTHPDQGTKSATFSYSKKKVLSLMKNLASHDEN